jgi:hypothetical protein
MCMLVVRHWVPGGADTAIDLPHEVSTSTPAQPNDRNFAGGRMVWTERVDSGVASRTRTPINASAGAW